MADDSPEREFEGYDSECLSAVTLEHHDEESTSNLSESEEKPNRSNPMKILKPSRKPRREVWWHRLNLGATSQSLNSIGRCFDDRLNWSLLSSSNSLLRHVKSPKDDNLRQKMHQCPGYLREEITLTCDLSKSAIFSHAFPGPGERCSICHQLVPAREIEDVEVITRRLEKKIRMEDAAAAIRNFVYNVQQSQVELARSQGQILRMPTICYHRTDLASYRSAMSNLALTDTRKIMK